MTDERKEYTFLWFVENYSYCWHKNGEELISPKFTAEGLEGTVWTLHLYPRGYEDDDNGYISLFINRSKDDDGPLDFPLKYEFSFLAANGLTLYPSEYEHTFKKGGGFGPPKFAEIDEIFLGRKSDYLPQDTLKVRCKIWRGEGNIQTVTQICARTRIGIEQISFLHVAESFSTLEPNQRRTIQIRSPSEKRLALSSSLYFTDGSCCEEKIIVEITSSVTNQILSKYRLSLLDGSGKAIQCGEGVYRFDDRKQNTQKLTLSLTRQVILNRKNEYLPDDKLTLLCDCTFSSGVKYESIERTLHEIPLVTFNQINDNDRNKEIYDVEEKLSACTSLSDDFKAIYNNQSLTDVELKTKTKPFPAHKLVLCARSSVFHAMLTNDMKEKNTDCIQVDDLENDIVQQLLLFLYSDNLENLQWESAIKLYYAGDKYALEKLKVMCSSFLVQNLSTSTASELLLLADTHNHSQLKKAVEDFIFKHEEQVFGSEEWRSLIKTNPVLVSETMCLKYMRKI